MSSTAEIIPASLSRTARLIGPDATARLSQVHVILFGLGGVGSWAAEALVRSGVCHITIVDADTVAESNINRQLPALPSTVGIAKTQVMAERLRAINPGIDLTQIHGLYTADTADSYDLTAYDYIIDAIDSLSDKALLILRATEAMRQTASSERPVKFYSSMGAALKLDPTRIRVAEFWKVTGCPLAAALRRRFKKSSHMPARKFLCVYSDELIPNHPDYTPSTRDTAMTFNKVAFNGSMMHITATFGMTLASLVIKDCVKLCQ